MRRKNIKNDMMDFFLLHPTVKLRVREIERRIGVPLPSAIRYCRELLSEKILTVEKIGGVTLYSANRAGDDYKLEKKLFNIRRIYKSRIIENIRRELSNPTIIVFGSYARGEDIETSDIDLYIETESSKAIQMDAYQKKLKRTIHEFRHKNIRDIKNTAMANNILNGYLLNGNLEVIR